VVEFFGGSGTTKDSNKCKKLIEIAAKFKNGFDGDKQKSILALAQSRC
jgi:uncharacterized protein YycO